MQKIKQSQVKAFRERMLAEQGGICALCNQIIVDDAVLDHDHGTGHIRRVLHRACNALEGKIQNFVKTFGQNINIDSFMSSLPGYWQGNYSLNPIHYSHVTDVEREIKNLRKLMKSAKRDETKSRHAEKILELKKQIKKYEI